jgi:saccharopine dehydrogenase-like NADP-dependent oxidoreductase
MPGREVVVIGAGGAQAEAMLVAASRADAIDGWAGVDRAWSERGRRACEELGLETLELDVLAEPDRLCETIAGASLVANFAGPYDRTGGAVLDACIEVGCDYLDVCDDAGATMDLLSRTIAASAAGVRALIGMGSPGIANVAVRAGADVLGGADEAWLSHPGPITIPRFLGIEAVRTFGSIGAADGSPGDLVVEVWVGAEGIRFVADERAGIGDSAGAPAAAGILLMLEDGPGDCGVIAPECLDPAEFFAALGRCSRRGGSLGAYRLQGSEQGERIPIRDLLQTRVR